MELFDIIKEEDIVTKNGFIGSINAGGFSCDTRKIKRGDVFFAIPGANTDGCIFVAEAYSKGAVAIVTEENTEKRIQIPVIVVKDVRSIFSRAAFFEAGDPQKKMKVIGITGTNGKTTIATAMHKIITDAGKKCALFTTVGYDVCGKTYPSSHTTPPPEILAPLFAEALENGAEYAVMEVSSHALSQKRVDAIDFQVGIFTNITRDHLDYHKTMEEYIKVKSSLFEKCENSVINFDDEKGEIMAKAAKGKVYSISEKNPESKFFIKNPKVNSDGISYELSGNGLEINIDLGITGNFNIYNTAECAAASLILGIDEKTVVSSLASFCGVPGRMQRICKDKLPYSVIIDYAHTPDALSKALIACRGITKGKLICVFGCGGNRDKGKRREMGKIASTLSDLAVITSDNPRNEDPDEIIREITLGIPDSVSEYVKITSREEAIEYAMTTARAGDTVLLAGKGHEDYIIDANGKHRFYEPEIVEKIIERKGL